MIALPSMPFNAKEEIDPVTGAVTYDRVATAEDLAKWLHAYVGNGVLVSGGGPLTAELRVSHAGGLALTVEPGQIAINGRTAWNDAPVTLAADAGESLPRIDRVVQELNNNVEDRTIYLKILRGTPAQTPKPPELTQTADVYQMSLCQYTVAAGSAVITGLIDERPDPELCGISNVKIATEPPKGNEARNILITQETADKYSLTTGTETVEDALSAAADRLVELETSFISYTAGDLAETPMKTPLNRGWWHTIGETKYVAYKPAMVYLKPEIHAIGAGYSPSGSYNPSWHRMNMQTGTTTITEITYKSNGGFAAELDGLIYTCGSNFMYSHEPVTSTQTRLSMTGAREGYAMVAYDGAIYCVGSSTATSSDPAIHMKRFDPTTQTLTEIPLGITDTVFYPNTFFHGDVLHIIYPSATIPKHVTYNMRTGQVGYKTPLAVPEYTHSSGAENGFSLGWLRDGKVYLTGIYGNTSRAYTYDVEKDEWEEVDIGTPLFSRSGTSSAVVDGNLVVHSYKDFYLLDPYTEESIRLAPLRKGYLISTDGPCILSGASKAEYVHSSKEWKTIEEDCDVFVTKERDEVHIAVKK